MGAEKQKKERKARKELLVFTVESFPPEYCIGAWYVMHSVRLEEISISRRSCHDQVPRNFSCRSSRFPGSTMASRTGILGHKSRKQNVQFSDHFTLKYKKHFWTWIIGRTKFLTDPVYHVQTRGGSLGASLYSSSLPGRSSPGRHHYAPHQAGQKSRGIKRC